MHHSRIIATGSYLPDRVMPNTELESLVDTTDEWIRARTGIRQRHIAAEDETTSDMACVAARRALESADIDADTIDLIVLATSTPDLIYPGTACLLQDRLNIKNGAPAFDLQAVCSGFIYALSVADQFIKTGAAGRVLVVAADMNSRILDWKDRSTCVLFGDGAGAVVMERAEQPGIYKTLLHADGSYASFLQVPSGVSKPTDDPYVRMSGGEVFKFAVKVMDEIVAETLADTEIGLDDIDWLIPHQANERIINATANKLQLPMDKVILTVGDHGNTSGASIPLALDTGVRDGRVKAGDIVLLEGVGAGFTWGAALLRY
ncbi:MAG: beta-ketoacyl-ACP synthase III [Gammaproteobacteria bacterium]